MKIIFMGTPAFALPSLERLTAEGYGVSLVVTAPDKPRGRGQLVSATPVKEFALRRGIPVLQPVSLRDPEFAAAIAALQPDLCIVVAFRILPKEIYAVPKFGSFNLHASLLPKYRGAAPINWALMNGETETGVTTFFLQEKVDTGKIILQKKLPVPSDMNAGELHDALSVIGADAVIETVRLIERGDVVPAIQDDGHATPAPKIFKETCRIDWNRPSADVHNFVRGLSPSPAAWTLHRGRNIKIFRTVRSHSTGGGSGLPGVLTAYGRSLSVRTADGTIEITELQQEGKRRMGTEEFLRGYSIGNGERFE